MSKKINWIIVDGKKKISSNTEQNIKDFITQSLREGIDYGTEEIKTSTEIIDILSQSISSRSNKIKYVSQTQIAKDFSEVKPYEVLNFGFIKKDNSLRVFSGFRIGEQNSLGKEYIFDLEQDDEKDSIRIVDKEKIAFLIKDESIIFSKNHLSILANSV